MHQQKLTFTRQKCRLNWNIGVVSAYEWSPSPVSAVRTLVFVLLLIPQNWKPIRVGRSCRVVDFGSDLVQFKLHTVTFWNSTALGNRFNASTEQFSCFKNIGRVFVNVNCMHIEVLRVFFCYTGSNYYCRTCYCFLS